MSAVEFGGAQIQDQEQTKTSTRKQEETIDNLGERMQSYQAVRCLASVPRISLGVENG